MKYVIWVERDEREGGVEAAFEVGKVFRFEGADAETLWRRVAGCADTRDQLVTVAYGRPVTPGR